MNDEAGASSPSKGVTTDWSPRNGGGGDDQDDDKRGLQKEATTTTAAPPSSADRGGVDDDDGCGRMYGTHHNDDEDDKDDDAEGRHEHDDDEADNITLGEWRELMGKELLIKTVSMGGHKNGVPVQPQDAVIVDIIGRLASSHVEAPRADQQKQKQEQKHHDDNDGPVFLEFRDALVTVGDKDVIPAIEMGIRFMHVSERAFVWSHSKYSYGVSRRRHYHDSSSHRPSSVRDDGKDKDSSSSSKDKDNNSNNYYELPPNSHCCYEIYVKSVVEAARRNEWAFQVQAGLAKKVFGNDAYKNEWPDGKSRALRLYKKGADALEWVAAQIEQQGQQQETEEQQGDSDGQDVVDNGSKKSGREGGDHNDISGSDSSKKQELLQQQAAVQGMIDCLNNIVAVYMRSGEYHAAKEAAVQVLQRDAVNVKALLRAAKAALLDPASSYEEVHAALSAAEEVVIMPNNNNNDNDNNDVTEIRKLRAQFKRQKRNYDKRSKAMMQRMVKDVKVTTDDNNNNNNTTTTAAASGKTNKSSSKDNDDDDKKLNAAIGVADNANNKNDDAATSSSSFRLPDEIENRPPIRWKKLVLQYAIQIVLPLLAYRIFLYYKGNEVREYLQQHQQQQQQEQRSQEFFHNIQQEYQRRQQQQEQQLLVERKDDDDQQQEQQQQQQQHEEF